MAAASAIIMAASTAASVGMGVYKTSQANKQMKEAQKNIESYERQTLDNVYAGIDVPYQMYNLETEQIRQRSADAASQAAMAGARGLAILPAIQENESAQQAEANARMEQNLYQLQLRQRQDEIRKQQMTEQREYQDLSGYGAMYEAGRQTKYAGMGDIIQGVQGLGGVIGQITTPGASQTTTPYGNKTTTPYTTQNITQQVTPDTYNIPQTQVVNINPYNSNEVPYYLENPLGQANYNILNQQEYYKTK